jgi:drug/metabolite transporter (DMT)-like permease
MNLTILLVILATITLTAGAQLALKLAVTGLGPDVRLFDSWPVFLGVLFAPGTMLAMLIYGLSIVSWLWVLSRVELTVAYPFLGLSFVIAMFFGVWFLDEALPPSRVIGTLLIFVGCTLVARSA